MHDKIKQILALAFILAVAPVFAATIVWSGASGTDTNWSNGNNWAGAVAPGGGDDLKFCDAGTNLTLGVPNSLVDGAFVGQVGSLQLGNTNGLHTIVIAAGTSLGITNGNLTEGTATDPGPAKNFTNSITGAGGALYVSNLTANIAINQAGATTGNRANLNLSGLDNFAVSANRIGIGDGQFPGVAANNKAGGNLILARTNVITLAYTDTLANYQTAGKNAAIILSRNSGNNPGLVSILQLGIANTFNVDSMNFGMDKAGNLNTPAHGIMVFNSAFAGQNPVANFYGAGGPGTRVTWWSIGDGNSSGSSSNGGGGTNDFSLGTVNALVNVMSLGRDAAVNNDAWAGPHKGVFTFTNGTVDVNTLILGNQSLETGTSSTPSLGVFNVIGSGAWLKVNTVMALGTTTLANAAGTGTRSLLNITNGTVNANNITVGVNSVSNIINLANGTLIVSNTIATNAAGLFSLSAANSILGLTVPANGSLVGLVQTLAAGGVTNVLQLNVPVFGSYPRTIPLIQYTTLSGAFNFGLTNIPASAPGAYLTNLTTIPKSIALVLPTDPRPVITAQPSGYSGNPGDNVTTNFSVSIAGTSVTPLAFQWYYYTNGGATNLLADGPGPSGTSTLSGTTTTNLQIANAQVADSGNYFVLVTNPYGSTPSSVNILTISSGGPPIINPAPQNQTVIQGNAATFSAGVSANPAATVYWQMGGADIPGANSSTLIIPNVQYPANDQQVYSIIASNSFGSVTNSATLTVIVPPTITVQPTSLVVTNSQSASFSVVVVGAVPAEAYQWKKNGVPISPNLNSTATNATFTIPSVSPGDISTNYSVTITNLAGTTNSTSVSLTVNSTMSPVTLSPANAQTGVCYDTPLYITFDQTPLTRNAGTIKIYNATNPVTPVDTLDMSQNSVITQIGTGIASYPVNVQPRTIAGASYVTFPVIITSNTAAIYPHEGVMTSNQTYYVTVDNGVFTDTNGAYFVGIAATNSWQFKTKLVGPPANTNYVVVSTDGTADFCTIQGAVDFLPNFTNTTAWNRVIYLRKGNSVEIVRIPVGKNNITLRGESRQESLLSYPNSNLINPSSHTVMVLHVLANDIAMENLKLTNSVPQGGSQSFALMVETGAKRFICNNADVDSYQDTILVNTIDSSAYFYRSLIQGDVDFIWGGGNCYFTNCELRELRTGGIYTQPRTPAGSNGMAFVRCKLTRLNGTNASGSNFTNCLFARALGNTNSNVGLIYCNIDTNVVQTGWTPSDINDAGLAERWWEYGNSNLDGTLPVAYNGIQLTSNDPRLLAAQNATTWLYGWTPALAPNIIGQPANATVSQGQSTSFNVSATGIPDPTYQWYQNGQLISGATATNYNIGSAARANAGNYTVVVSNGSGSVTSVVSTLTYNNTTPVVNPSTDSRPAGYPLVIAIAGNLATYWSDADADSLALTGGISSTNGATVSYDSSSVYYTNANDVADQINYTVGDGFGGTAAGVINVAVTPAPTSTVAGTVVNGDGTATLSIVGVPGYTYQLDATMDLTPPVVWTTISTNTADINGLWQFTDQQATNYPDRFYRSAYRP